MSYQIQEFNINNQTAHLIGHNILDVVNVHFSELPPSSKSVNYKINEINKDIALVFNNGHSKIKIGHYLGSSDLGSIHLLVNIKDTQTNQVLIDLGGPDGHFFI